MERRKEDMSSEGNIVKTKAKTRWEEGETEKRRETEKKLINQSMNQ